MLIGHDGIVLAVQPGHALEDLRLEDLWRALAARVPDPAGGPAWVANPYRRWDEVRAGLPAWPIRALGPPATSGTRDAFAALALRPACEAALADHPQPDAERRHCGELRRDGAWQDAGEHDDALVAQLRAGTGALGVVGFGALVRNPGLVRAVCLDGVCPTAETIRGGEYPLTRALYLYLKPAHRAFVPRLDALVAAFFSSEASGPGGYLLRLGLVPAAAPPAPAPPPAGRAAAARRPGRGAPGRRAAAGPRCAGRRPVARTPRRPGEARARARRVGSTVGERGRHRRAAGAGAGDAAGADGELLSPGAAR
jgi:phosphate transport system substrate-binding protein